MLKKLNKLNRFVFTTTNKPNVNQNIFLNKMFEKY